MSPDRPFVIRSDEFDPTEKKLREIVGRKSIGIADVKELLVFEREEKRRLATMPGRPEFKRIIDLQLYEFLGSAVRVWNKQRDLGFLYLSSSSRATRHFERDMSINYRKVCDLLTMLPMMAGSNLRQTRTLYGLALTSALSVRKTGNGLAFAQHQLLFSALELSLEANKEYPDQVAVEKLKEKYNRNFDDYLSKDSF
ncbi:MAG TPA: hypothetical protein VF185_04065 [Patescibacteria group bacterium]